MVMIEQQVDGVLRHKKDGQEGSSEVDQMLDGMHRDARPRPRVV